MVFLSWSVRLAQGRYTGANSAFFGILQKSIIILAPSKVNLSIFAPKWLKYLALIPLTSGNYLFIIWTILLQNKLCGKASHKELGFWLDQNTFSSDLLWQGADLHCLCKTVHVNVFVRASVRFHLSLGMCTFLLTPCTSIALKFLRTVRAHKGWSATYGYNSPTWCTQLLLQHVLMRVIVKHNSTS